jgi:hypothetical protein
VAISQNLILPCLRFEGSLKFSTGQEFRAWVGIESAQGTRVNGGSWPPLERILSLSRNFLVLPGFREVRLPRVSLMAHDQTDMPEGKAVL